MTIQATTVVSFNSDSFDADYVFKIELDDTLNLDSEGDPKTSFSPSDRIYLMVHKSANVDITDVVVTAGTIRHSGSGARSGETTNLFAVRDDSDDGDYLLDFVTSNTSISYIGRQGALDTDYNNLGQPVFKPDKSKTPFIAKFNYFYNILSYLWTAPTMTLEEEETFDMAVVFYINVR